MNNVILKGRTTRDIEIKYLSGTNGQLAIASFILAVNRRWAKDGEQTADFITCKAFGKVAETLEKYVTKGQEIVICGKIQTGSYTNKDGQKVYTTDVIVSELDFCGSKKDNERAERTTQNAQTDENGFMNIPDNVDDELPFN